MWLIDVESYFLMALCLLMLPLRWTMGAFLAVAVHEMFHAGALAICGVRVAEIRIRACGVQMFTQPLKPAAEAFCALAGPAGSFCLLLSAVCFPEAALIGLIQGIYNLLPIYPLDGGRFLRSILPEPICKGIETFTWIIILGGGVWLWVTLNMVVFPLSVTLWILMVLIHGKFPCKAGKLAVQ